MFRKLFILLLITLTQAAYAEKPAACPDLSAIKMIGIKHVSLSGGVWAGYILRGYYDTAYDLSFAIYGFSAKDEPDAFKQANESITQMELIDGPIRDGEGWHCSYMGNENNPELGAIATLYTH